MVNADDFGLSPGVNAGIARARREGVLTSTTIMANAPFFDGAAALAAESPGLGVGIHLNLVRGFPLSPPKAIPLLVGPDDRLRPFRFKPRLTPEFLSQAEGEWRRQFERVLAAGIRATHVDFEKHHPWQAPLYLLACRLAAEYGVNAVRNLREPVIWSIRRLGWPGWRRVSMAAALRAGLAAFGARECPLARPDRMLGQTHIGAMDEEVWLRLLRHLPAGTSEVMTHPGEADDPGDPRLAAMGAGWLGEGRRVELAALISGRVRRAAAEAGVDLVNFSCIERRMEDNGPNRIFSRHGT